MPAAGVNRRALYLDQPFEVAVETLALCNAACTFCPYPTLERIGTALPTELIHALIDEMARFAVPFVFSPFKVNEPFLDPRLHEICLRFSERCPQGQLRLFTNGSALTQRNIAEIAKLPRVRHLWISLNTCDPQEHQRLMQFKRPQYVRIAGHLDRLQRAKEVDEFPHEVMISRVAQSDTGDFEFLRECQRRWPDLTAILIKKDAWLQDIEAPQYVIPNASCQRWFELSITARGVASLCCMDSVGRFSIGNVYEETLLEIYNRPAWRERRERMLSRRVVPVCHTCSY